MPSRMTFSRLVSRIQTGRMSRDELDAYFVPYVDPHAPHLPAVAIREDQVDIRGIEGAAREAASRLYWDALKRPSGAAEAARAVEPSIVAEGDSWFRLPGLWFPRTMIDYLSQSLPVRNIAYWGHEFLANVVEEREYVFHINRKLRFLILSAGGNDFLGRLQAYIYQRRSGDNDASNAASYVRPEFHELIARVHEEYRSIAKLTERLAPQAYVIVHGYDYPKPQARGDWLGPRLIDRGFHPGDNKVITDALLRVMLDAFNQKLSLLAKEFRNVRYVNFRGEVGDRFADELHPNDAAAQQLSRMLQIVIEDPDDSRAIPVG